MSILSQSLILAYTALVVSYAAFLPFSDLLPQIINLMLQTFYIYGELFLLYFSVGGSMKILRDPIWQFYGVMVSILGIVIALLIAFKNPLASVIGVIAALILLLIFYLKIRPSMTIFFRLISDTTVLSFKREDNLKSEIQVLYKGKEVEEDIHLISLKFWNAGNEPILPNYYKVPIRISFGKDAKILSGHVLYSEPPSLKNEIDKEKLIEFDEENVVLHPVWLNTDNSLTFEVLLTNFQEISIDETRIIVGGYVRAWDQSGYSKVKQIIDQRVIPNTILLTEAIAGLISLFIFEFIDFANISTSLRFIVFGLCLLLFIALWITVNFILNKFLLKWISQTFE